MDYYNLLGVPPSATGDEVRRAFRVRAKAVHPDAHPAADSAEREALRRRFILLAQAYETLSDPGRRAAYDRTRPAPGPRGAAAGAPGSTGWRSTQARFGRARRTVASPPPSGESLDELLRDVEGLLGRFGLDLRPPFEALLDALLDWARAVYRQVMGADAPPRGGDKGSPAGGGTRSQGASAGPRRSRARREGAQAGADTDWVEAELDALRRRVRRAGPRPARGEDVEAELRRLKERLGRRG